MLRRVIAAVSFLFVVGMVTTVMANDAILQKFAEQEQYYALPSGILAKVARIESNGNAQALNGSTQAGGLFQWIPRYWYDAASKVYPPGSGALNPQARFNPFIATEVTAYNLAYVRTLVGSRIQAANADQSVGLYMGHFLGPAGAGKFFSVLRDNPNASAAQYFPKEARYNGSVFNGRTVAGVYNFFAAKMNQPGITGVSNYTSAYDGPGAGRLMDSAGSKALSGSYAGTPGSADQRSYPTTYDEEKDRASIEDKALPNTGTGSTNATPHALLLIAQPSRISSGQNIVISWVSVGMSTDVPCVVNEVGGEVFAKGNEGTKHVVAPTVGSERRVTFTMICVPRGAGQGTTRSQTSVVVVP